MRVLDPDLKDGNLYEGFVVDLLDELSLKLNFDYDLDLVRNGRYGAPTQDGNWNGMIGQLYRGDADIAAAALTVTSMRAQVVDFTQTYMLSESQILMTKPRQQSKSMFDTATILLDPLSVSVWVLTIVANIVVSVILYVIGRWSPFEWRAIARGMSSPLKKSFNLKKQFLILLQHHAVARFKNSTKELAAI